MSTMNRFGDAGDGSRPVPHSAREQLDLWIDSLSIEGGADIPVMPIRPLGLLSDFACEQMAGRIDAVDAREIGPEQFFDEVEELMITVPVDVVDALVDRPGSTASRVAALDLMMVERALCVVHGGPTQHYRARRSQTVFFRTLRRLARAQGRPLLMGWVDIANWHPVYDPRTFVSTGTARDQEILLYRIQHGIERSCQRIVVEWPVDYMSPRVAEEMTADLEVMVQAMIYLRRARANGEFDRLNRFLTPNGEILGHATGSFSAWTMLAAYVLTGHLPGRLLLEENRAAYDPDARPFIDAAAAGELTPLPRMRGADPDGADIEQAVNNCIRLFGRFLEVHRGAVRSQAAEALTEQAPSDPEVTNLQSINEIIASTKNAEWSADHTAGVDEPEAAALDGDPDTGHDDSVA